MECIFCKIINRDIKSPLLYEDDLVIAFDDIHPQTEQHKLIIPREHIDTLNELDEKHEHLMGHMILVAQKIAKKLDIAREGYRLVLNCNQQGGQEVYHIHLHLLGGRQMHWPPG